MIRENPKFLFSSKKGYIFIKFGSEWVKGLSVAFEPFFICPSINYLLIAFLFLPGVVYKDYISLNLRASIR